MLKCFHKTAGKSYWQDRLCEAAVFHKCHWSCAAECPSHCVLTFLCMVSPRYNKAVLKSLFEIWTTPFKDHMFQTQNAYFKDFDSLFLN